MSLGINIRVDVGEARKKINRLINLLDPVELLTAIGNRHVKWMVDNLRQAGSEKKHKPMAPSTIAARPRRTSSSHFSSRWRSRLAQSFTARVLGTTAVVAGTEDQLAEYHHFGTGPTVIRPSSRKLLKFKTENGFVFAKEVHHPGIPARQLIPTKQSAERLAHGVLDAAIKRKISQAGVG